VYSTVDTKEKATTLGHLEYRMQCMQCIQHTWHTPTAAGIGDTSYMNVSADHDNDEVNDLCPNATSVFFYAQRGRNPDFK